MVASLFYWLVLPFLLAFGLVKIIQRSPRPVPADIKALLEKDPLPAKGWGAARRDAAGLASLGAFEKLLDASDAAWKAQAAAKAAGKKGSFLVFDAAGVVVEQADA